MVSIVIPAQTGIKYFQGFLDSRLRDCVAIVICHCETPLSRCGNLNIFKDLRDCFGRCTPSQMTIATQSLRGNDNIVGFMQLCKALDMNDVVRAMDKIMRVAIR